MVDVAMSTKGLATMHGLAPSSELRAEDEWEAEMVTTKKGAALSHDSVPQRMPRLLHHTRLLIA